MRNTLIVVALLCAASAHADQSVLTYHNALDRAGSYVVPDLTYERAPGLRLDSSFHAAFQGKVYAQPLLLATGIERRRTDRLDRRDLDLGGAAAIPLDLAGANGAGKLIFTVGKSGEAYLLDRDNLGGVGGALAAARVATNIAITSPAVWSAADGVIVVLQGDGAHCQPGEPAEGLVALKIRVDPAPAIETAWCASVARAGSPIVTTTDGRSDPIVWVVGAEGDNRLHAFRVDSGEPLAAPGETMRGLHHFQTLIAGEGRLYVAADGTIYAFAF